MICSKCGNIIPDSAKHCPFCGALAQGEQPMPSAQADAQAPVQIVPFCHICGLELAAGAQFCPVCGAAAGTKEKTAAFAAVYGAAPSQQESASAQAEDFADFADLGGAAAMTVASPMKKKSKLPLIAGICAGAAAVLAGVFVLNRSAFLPVFMGEAGYAAMIEAKGAADALAALDSTAASALIENAADSAVRYAALTKGGLYSYGSTTTPADIIAQTRSSLLSAYGKDEVEVMLTPSVEFTDTGKELLFGGDGYSEIVEAINACMVGVSLNAQEDAASLRITLDEGGAVTDADIILTDGAVYVELPFAETAFKSTISGGEDADAGRARLELDQKQTARLLGEIRDIYIKHYKSAQFTVERGELTAAGVTAKGQLVTCEMDGARLDAMAQDIGALLAEDEYLCGVITEYMQAAGAEFSVQEYSDAVKTAFAGLFGDNCSVTAKTVVNSACKTLAKSYVFKGSGELSLTYINGKTKAAFEGAAGGVVVTADVTRVNKQDGTINLKVTGKESFSAKLVYSGVKTQDFCGRKVLAGEVRVSCVPPADFTSGDSVSASVYAAISKAELTLSQGVESGVLKQRAELHMPQYGTAAVDAVVSARDGSAIEIPENALDESELFRSEESTRNVAEMLRSISQKADKSGYFAAQIAQAAEDYAASLEDSLKPKADISDISIMMNNIRGLQSTANELYNLYADVMTDELRGRCDDICLQLEQLADSIDYSMSEERFAELSDKVDAADKILGELIKALNKAQDATVPISQRGNIDYSDLSADEIGEAFSACEKDYLSIILVYYGAISEDEELVELYNKTLSAYEKASDDYYAMVDEISRGNWSVPIVRTARKSLQKFDEALTALEKKLPATTV